ncbi:hypothetical protein VNO80_33869 [Phaseolus coccineus]|uniref:Uncharacterized protein n=1 Tax=Phaseolus coccineus TaxID=3886 RepID=A0AAN9L2L9_PHACN
MRLFLTGGYIVHVRKALISWTAVYCFACQVRDWHRGIAYEMKGFLSSTVRSIKSFSSLRVVFMEFYPVEQVGLAVVVLYSLFRGGRPPALNLPDPGDTLSDAVDQRTGRLACEARVSGLLQVLPFNTGLLLPLPGAASILLS